MGKDLHARGTRMIQEGCYQIDQAIHLLRSALAHRLPPHVRRAETLTNLGYALLTRYLIKGSDEDLKDAIESSREATDIRPPPNPYHDSSATNLSRALWVRYESIKNPDDLDISISLCRKVLETTLGFDIDLATLLHNLARGVFARFSGNGSIEDLEECLSANRQSLVALNETHSQDSHLHGDICNNLSDALRARFQLQGSFADMEECIVLGRQALLTRPIGHPDRHNTLDNLAECLHTRFLRRGDFEDLSECISLSRESLKCQPYNTSPPRNRRRTMICLGQYLLKHFQAVSQDMLLLDESIRVLREALEHYPDLPPDVPVLAALAGSLSERYQTRRDVNDIEDAVALFRQALALAPPSSPRYPSSLSNLGAALYHRFEAKEDPGDIEEGIMYLQRASSSINAAHYHWCTVQGSLFSALRAKYYRTGLEEHFMEAYSVIEATAQNDAGPLLERFRLSWMWGNFGRARDHPSTMDAYRYTAGLLPTLASLDLTLSQRQNILKLSSDFANEAVLYAIGIKELEAAVVFFSTARSVFWTQALRLRTPVDNLASFDPGLADEYRAVSRQLEAASHGGAAHTDDAPSRYSDSTGTYSLAQRRDKLLDRIRNIEGFQDFLLPPTFNTLKDAARHGPVVFLNSTPGGCDAVVMNAGGSLLHVPLPKITHAKLHMLKRAVQELARGERICTETVRDIDDGLLETYRLKARRKRSHSTDDDFRFILTVLWTGVVFPVVKGLGLQKTDAPVRIWWCASGVFCFLPIHAAGDFMSDGPITCLHDYVISSYCHSPQELLTPPPEALSDYKVLAVIEPEATGIGAGPLPNTLDELDNIRRHIPSHDNLIHYIGTGGPSKSATNEDALKAIRQSSFVHFGCHGLQHPTNPLQSTLCLSGGKLTMKKIIRECQTSTPSFAFLSACQTAMNDEDRPDESLNLTATMMFAGFRSVIGTMWSIHDADAPIVADVFYRYLFRHREEMAPVITDAAKGLSLAVKELRDQGKHFSRWVPFVHFGL
ncbi:hypothetical protein FA15DRAFT_714731 [Coprinopsis marcescibilis]|uniref:CHAT domain-containing protein n=1 Tax=Coprinopsis marcescibilis TaxID=230819 RepID=A0A5C3KPT2_COPMA|nr:hypothetical protein FA15DRAFT_714731 [Coprinopsis marcescibilis]